MKLASIVLFLCTFDATYGLKTDAVESECSKHDNGLRDPNDAAAHAGPDAAAHAGPDADAHAGPDADADAPIDDNREADIADVVETTAAEEPAPAIDAVPAASATSAEATSDNVTSDNNQTRMEQANQLAESMFYYTQEAARLASSNPDLAKLTLKALRWSIRKVVNYYYTANGTVAFGTITASSVAATLKPIRQELTNMIQDPAHMKEVFDAIGAESVTYEGLKKTLQERAAQKIEQSDKAIRLAYGLRIVNLVDQSSDALARLGQAEWCKKKLDSGAGGYLKQGMSYLDSASKWFHRWASHEEGEETKKETEEIHKEVAADPDHDEDQKAAFDGTDSEPGTAKEAPAAEAKAPPQLTLAEVNEFTVPKLKAALKERNLPVTGLKAVLKARLLEALGYEDEDQI